MNLSLRAKLTAIVATAALAFVVIIAAGTLSLRRTENVLAQIEGRYVPRLDARPRLEAELERLQRSFQDAVSAHDAEAVAATRETKEGILALVASAGSGIDPGAAAAFRGALDDYYVAALDVSRRLIAGERGEQLVAAMGAMQQKQGRAMELLRTATALDRAELAGAFREASRALNDSARIRLTVSIACLLAVILLSTWLGRGVLRSVAGLTTGLERFGRGEFARSIAVESRDELGDVARRANEMAESLRRLSAERDRVEWLEAGHAGLARELRGELEPEEVATRAVRFLARALDAPVAALYTLEPDGALVLAAHHALAPLSTSTSESAPVPRFAPGEGLVGQAALEEELRVVENAPADYLRVRSGLGDAAPRAIVLLPLSNAGRVTGVLELGVFKPWSEQSGQLLRTVRETLAIAVVVARARAATRELLTATQRQAEKLAQQEEELRATNEELQAQEEELRQANTDLSHQTEELAAQRQTLADANQDLDEARQRLEHRAGELATVSAYKSQFLANMSHELRTPLNSMLLLSNLLSENEDHTLTARQVEFARTIYAAGKDLLALINQVLDLAKVESGRPDVTFAPAPLGEITTHLERVFTPLARDKGLALSVSLDPGLPTTIITDRQRLEQILTNLLGNALKFTARGEVSLRVEPAGSAARFKRSDLTSGGALAFIVSDTGVGIAPDDHERVFAPFEQVDGAADRKYGGTGLGLGIARELATLLGGELQLESSLGHGTKFTCYLPRAAPAHATAKAPPPATPVAATPMAARRESPAPAAGAPFLLLIEDDSIFASTFGEVIQAQGLAYIQAPSGQAGLRIAREQRPAGIILDVRLPDMDGWRVIEKLRADPATAAIPVHFVSALDAAERGLALGAVGYLRKPVTRADLIGVIDVLVPRAAERSARFLVVEDDKVTADSVVRMLEAEHLEVRRAGTAAEAIALLASEPFGCMILDLGLSDMNGLDLLRAVREGGGSSAPRVVVYTARALSRAETMALEAYAEAIILKDGSSVERLLDEVRLFVRRFGDGSATRSDATPVPTLADVRFEGRRVLVVDDDMRTVYALSAALRAKGIEVLAADTGKAALEELDRRPDVEVVLMDIMMPEMDGYEAMRRIRADARFAKLPIIALTAKAMKGDAEKCAEAGASHYLPKPIDAGRLVALLATCFRPAAGAAKEETPDA
jgi:CheY-like chemotaxis protein/signal transduction histidine kinase